MKLAELINSVRNLDPNLEIISLRSAINSSKKRIEKLKEKIKQEKEFQKTLLGK